MLNQIKTLKVKPHRITKQCLNGCHSSKTYLWTGPILGTMAKARSPYIVSSSWPKLAMHSVVLFFISLGSLPTHVLFEHSMLPFPPCLLGEPTSVKAALIYRPLGLSAVLPFVVKPSTHIRCKVTYTTYFQGTSISIQMWPLTPTKEFSVLYTLLMHRQHFPLLVHMKGHGFDLVNVLHLLLLGCEVAHLDFKHSSSFIASLGFHADKFLVTCFLFTQCVILGPRA